MFYSLNISRNNMEIKFSLKWYMITFSSATGCQDMEYFTLKSTKWTDGGRRKAAAEGSRQMAEYKYRVTNRPNVIYSIVQWAWTQFWIDFMAF